MIIGHFDFVCKENGCVYIAAKCLTENISLSVHVLLPARRPIV